MGLQITHPPTREPLTLAEAKQHLRQNNDAEDELILVLIAAARRQAEAFLRRPLLTTGYRWTRDTFPGSRLPSFLRPELISVTSERQNALMLLPVGGLQQVTAIRYWDASGFEQLLDPTHYLVDAAEQPARLAPAYAYRWPMTLPQLSAVTIEFTAGYGDSADTVPADILAAVKLLLGHLYENREATVLQTAMELPLGAEHLLWPHRVFPIESD